MTNWFNLALHFLALHGLECIERNSQHWLNFISLTLCTNLSQFDWSNEPQTFLDCSYISWAKKCRHNLKLRLFYESLLLCLACLWVEMATTKVLMLVLNQIISKYNLYRTNFIGFSLWFYYKINSTYQNKLFESLWMHQVYPISHT